MISMFTHYIIILSSCGHHHRNDANIKGVGDSGGLRIRKFRQEDYHDDSEEDGTYNGNSTQQQ
jgi:hypothetical protein